MLAKRGAPFDSQAYLFEVKWDGIRAIAFIDTDGYRLMNRRGVDMTLRYPELCFLQGLPAGTILDGEIVVLDQGKPSLARLLSRENVTSPVKVRMLAKRRPVHLIVFDQLYHRFRPIMAEPIEVRRKRLQETVGGEDPARLIMSEAVTGEGRALFEEVVRRDLEGVMAKRLGSRYWPNRRTDAWLKIKKRSRVLCAILGFQPSGNLKEGFRCLILAADGPAGLEYVGKVGTGFGRTVREALYGHLCSRTTHAPLVPCPEPGVWVEAGLYCEVSYLERTGKGELRDPVFERLILP
jgi:ATP-dependent DNA ligase